MDDYLEAIAFDADDRAAAGADEPPMTDAEFRALMDQLDNEESLDQHIDAQASFFDWLDFIDAPPAEPPASYEKWQRWSAA